MSRAAKARDPKSLRDEQGDAVRERLLAAAMALLDEGLEPTMRAVAAGAGVSERTIYRYFESREALFDALRPRLLGKAGVALCATFAELEAYAVALFATFERNRKLVVALLTSAWSAPYLRVTRRDNLDAMRKLIDDAFPDAPADARAAAASTLRAALSGAGWHYLRESCGLRRDEVVAHARWLVRQMAVALGARDGASAMAPTSSRLP